MVQQSRGLFQARGSLVVSCRSRFARWGVSLLALAALMAVGATGAAAPPPSPQAIRRLEAARLHLAQAESLQGLQPDKAARRRVEGALDALNAAREAAYGPDLTARSAAGNFDGTIQEVEPNNSAPAAQSLDAVLIREGSAVVMGEIRAAGDQDFFSFTAPAGARVWAYVDTGGAQFPGATSRDSVLTLVASDQTTILESDDDDGVGNGGDTIVETGFASAITGHPLPAPGTYYLGIREWANSGTLSPYRLYLVVTTTDPAADSESLDANPLLPAGAQMGMFAGTASTTDVDFFRVAVQQGDVMTLQIDEDPTRNGTASFMEVVLYSPEGVTLIAADSASQAFSFRVPTGGLYIVRVMQLSPVAAGDYVLLAAVHTRAISDAAVINGLVGSGSAEHPAISGRQVGRLVRNGVASNADLPPKPFPGRFNTDQQAFDAYLFKNRSGLEARVTVTLTAYDSNFPFSSTYSTFDPGNLASGYLADGGLSPAALTKVLYSLRVAPGEVFVVLVATVLGPAPNIPYTLTLTGDSLRSSLVGCPADMVVPNDLNQAGAVVNYNPPGTTDPSLGPVDCTPPPGSFFPIGITQVVCRDQIGTECTFAITVKDVQAPTVSVPASAGAVQSQAAGAAVLFNVTAGDNAPGVGLVCAPPSGSVFPVGPTLVTCTATDAAGNTANKAFLVTVTPPASTLGVKVKGKGNVATGDPAAAFTANGSVSATGVIKMTVTYTQSTAGQSLKSNSVSAVARTGNQVRIFGKIRNNKGQAQDFMLELADVAKPGANQDLIRLDVASGFQLAQTVISKGEISLKP
jgi:hypothetical protein